MKLNLLRKPFLQTIIFSIILALLNFLLGSFKSEWLYHYQWLLLLYFFIITLVSIFIVEYSAEKNAEDIAKSFFIAMMIRLFLSVIIATIIIYVDNESSTIFALNFVIFYLLFLGFEIYYLISNLQSRFNSGN